MAGPVSAGESRVGRVKAAHLEAQGGSVAEKDPVADRAMDGVVGEAIGRRLLEVEPGVAAEDVEQIAGGPEIQHQAGAAVGQRGRGAAGLRIGALVARVELCADDVTEEIAQPAATADLVVQVEDLVVAGERSEGAELELVRALRTEAGDSARERCSQDGECSHGPASPYRAGPTVITRAPVRNPGGRSLVTWVTRLLAPVLAAHEPDGPGEVVGERRQFGRAVRQALDGVQLLRGGGGDCFGFLTGGVGAPLPRRAWGPGPRRGGTRGRARGRAPPRSWR